MQPSSVRLQTIPSPMIKLLIVRQTHMPGQRVVMEHFLPLTKKHQHIPPVPLTDPVVQ